MKQWRKVLAGALLGSILMTTPAMADWINMEKGPGMAQWVDENGNVSEPPVARGTQEGGQAQSDDGSGGLTPEQAAAAAVLQTGAQAAEEAERAKAAEAQAAADTQAAAEARAAADAAAAQRAAEEAAAQRAAGGRYVDPNKPMIALTYDDGPYAPVDNRIMDLMAQYGGRATFFMVGERVASRKSVVQRMVAEGHEVANHTMNHKYLQKQGAAEIQRQVQQCNDAIYAASGVRPTLMRLPGGNYNSTVLANTHMPMIQWNIDTLDWKSRNADQIVAKVIGHVKDGDIVLMHELYEATGEASARIIPALVAEGYQLVTVSEMAAAKGRPLQAGQLYSSLP